MGVVRLKISYAIADPSVAYAYDARCEGPLGSVQNESDAEFFAKYPDESLVD